MEIALRNHLLQWLASDPVLATRINSFTEEAPPRATPPWLGIVASAAVDWSVKDRRGREIRLALELHCRGDDPATAADLLAAIELRIESLPPALPPIPADCRIASCTFLRARAERRPGNVRAMLLEYRFRLLAN